MKVLPHSNIVRFCKLHSNFRISSNLLHLLTKNLNWVSELGNFISTLWNVKSIFDSEGMHYRNENIVPSDEHCLSGPENWKCQGKYTANLNPLSLYPAYKLERRNWTQHKILDRNGMNLDIIDTNLKVFARRLSFPTCRNCTVVKTGNPTYKEQSTEATKWPKSLSIIYVTAIKVKFNG